MKIEEVGNLIIFSTIILYAFIVFVIFLVEHRIIKEIKKIKKSGQDED